MAIDLNFYRYTGEPNALDKYILPYPTADLTLSGTFRMPIDVVNPTVIAELSGTVAVDDFLLNGYNYLHITGTDSLDRWYFVVAMRALSDKLVEIDLHEDVLMQYRTEIYSLQCFVNRCSSDSYINAQIDDPAQKYQSRRTIAMNVMRDTDASETLVNTSFNLLFPSSKNVVLIAYNQAQTESGELDPVLYKPAYTTAVSFDGGYLPDINRQKFALGGAQEPSGVQVPFKWLYHGKTYYLSCNQENFLLLQAIIAKTGNAPEEIKNALRPVAIAFPFAIPTADTIATDYSPVFIGSHPVVHSVGEEEKAMSGNIINPCSGYLVLADFRLIGADAYSDYPPYATWECFIPFNGWVTIPTSSLKSRLIVYYVVDYTSGQAQATLYDLTYHISIWSGSCQLGVQIDISGDNRAELNRQETANTLNTILQTAGGAVATIAGGASNNPVAVAGGVLSMTRAIGGGVVNAMNMIDRAQVGFSNGNNALFQPNRVMVRKLTLPRLLSPTTLKPIIGLPCSKVLTLSVLHGTGFANVADVYPHLYSGMMRTEWEEIVRLLKEGVFL